MATTPLGIFSTHARPRPRTLTCALLLALVLSLVACTGSPPGTTDPEPTIPAEATLSRPFPAYPDRDPGILTDVTAFASDGTIVVAAANARATGTADTFWYSEDAGMTWAPGSLSPAAQEASLVADQFVSFAAVSVHEAERRWLVLGQTTDALLSWRSGDGRMWERVVVDGLDLHTDRFSDMAAVGDTFYLLGQRNEAATGHGIPHLWTSTDGITWTGSRVADLDGDVTLTSLASHADTLVAVGVATLPALDDAGRAASPVAVVSRNGGVTWDRRPVAEPSDTAEFVTQLHVVRWAGDRFLAAGMYYAEGTYRSWVTTSPDGVAWDTPTGFGQTEDFSSVDDLVVTEQGMMLIERRRRGRTTSVTGLAGSDFAQWKRVQPTGVDGNSWSSDVVAVGSTALWSIQNEAHDMDFRVMRTADLGRSWQEIRLPAPTSMAPRVQPMALTLRDGVLTAWGEAQGATTAWTRTADDSWGAPQLVRDEARERLLDAIAGPNGFLIRGKKDGDAQILTSPDGEAWTESAPSTFNSVDPFQGSSANDAVWFGDRWVIVGGRTTNGSVRESALVASTQDGTSWDFGTHTSVMQRGDSYDESDLATDLDGLENLGRTMRGVGVVPSGLLAVGRVTGEAGSRPAVWSSDDGKAWRLTELPLEGKSEGVADEVSSFGDVILLRGDSGTADSSTWTSTWWRSTDQGTTFAHASGPEAVRSAEMLLGTDARGFLVVAGQEGSAAPVLWRSADGVSWEESSLATPPLDGGIEAQPVDMVVNGDTLHVLIRMVGRSDAAFVVVDAPLA